MSSAGSQKESDVQAECRRSKVKHYVNVIAHVYIYVHQIAEGVACETRYGQSSHDILYYSYKPLAANAVYKLSSFSGSA